VTRIGSVDARLPDVAGFGLPHSSRSPAVSVEVGQQVIFTTLFPITFVSTAFVPLQALPSFLQPFAEWNPTSTLTNALRGLWGNPNPLLSDSLPAREPVLVTLGWVVVIIAIFGPLGVRRYRSMSR
jgi:ABC-type multidrug transport system permease subunit